MNKVVLLLSALFLIRQLPAKSQTAAVPGSGHPATAAFSRWSLSLETGPSFPVGAFHDKTAYSTSAGYARTGIGAELATTYRFCPSFGLRMSAEFQDNPSATTTIIEEIPGPFRAPEEVVKRQSWKTGRLLAGAVYEHALSKNKRLALQIRAMAGVTKTGIPGLKYLYASTENVDVVWRYDHLSPGFAYQADAGCKYTITKRVSALVNAGYTGSRFTGRFSYEILDQDGSAFETGRASKTIALGTIQCRAGIEIGL